MRVADLFSTRTYTCVVPKSRHERRKSDPQWGAEASLPHQKKKKNPKKTKKKRNRTAGPFLTAGQTTASGRTSIVRTQTSNKDNAVHVRSDPSRCHGMYMDACRRTHTILKICQIWNKFREKKAVCRASSNSTSDFFPDLSVEGRSTSCAEEVRIRWIEISFGIKYIEALGG